MTVSDSHIVAAFSAAFTALTTVITVMWKKLSSDHKKLVVRSEACETDRDKLWRKIAELTGDAEMLKRCPAEACPMKPPSRRTTKILPRHREHPVNPNSAPQPT